MLTRRRLLAGTLAAVAAPLALKAEVKNAARVGYLVSQSVTPEPLEAFRKGLRELGWTKGQNLVLEVRSPEGHPERLPALAAALARLPVDVLVATGAPASLAAKEATTTVPIVSVYTLDPVALGLVASLARPSGNVTALSTLALEYVGKMLQFLVSVVPTAPRVAVLGDPTNASYAIYWRQLNQAARTLRVTLTPADVRRSEQLERVFAKIRGGQTSQGLLVMHQPFTFVHRKRIVTLAATHRLPAIYGSREAAVDGGLMAFGPSMPAIFRRAATFVDRILKGAKPADLPVEQPTDFELLVNMTTAKALGVTIPPSLLARADQVIE